MATLDRPDGLRLVLVRADRLGLAVSGLCRKALRRLWMDQALIGELLQRSAAFKSPVELEVWVAPEERALVDPLLNPLLDLRITELLEGPDVGLVGVLDIGEDVEGIHGRSCIYDRSPLTGGGSAIRIG
ncbi:hypothetical protein [Salinibacter ruber]|uniref:hypothetical protein n=1 Tax=Salinibacter ruber TaxID=146919 RepID=UPI0020746B97|nr:hypothetical protein [Salinibacter ruber]